MIAPPLFLDMFKTEKCCSATFSADLSSCLQSIMCYFLSLAAAVHDEHNEPLSATVWFFHRQLYELAQVQIMGL